MTTEDDFETYFQTYTRDKIDEIVGEIRSTATSNTESLRTLQAESAENKEGIRSLQNRLSESQTRASNLVQAAKSDLEKKGSDLEKKNSDLAKRVEKLESAPPPKASVSIPEKLDWNNQLYQYGTYDYKITVYHIVGPIYYVYIHFSNNILPHSNSRSVYNFEISQEIASLKLFFTPQKVSGLLGSNTLHVSSMNPGSRTFLLDGMGTVDDSVGRVGVYAISVVNSSLPDVADDHL